MEGVRCPVSVLFALFFVMLSSSDHVRRWVRRRVQWERGSEKGRENCGARMETAVAESEREYRDAYETFLDRNSRGSDGFVTVAKLNVFRRWIGTQYFHRQLDIGQQNPGSTPSSVPILQPLTARNSDIPEPLIH